MSRDRLQIACAACGFAAPPIVLIALFGTGIMPPEPADSSADEIAGFYADSSDLKMAALITAFMAIGLAGPLITVISVQLLRIDRRRPLLPLLQLVSGTVTWVFLAIPLLIMFVAAFRPNRPPEDTQMLHDLAWILFLIPIAPFIVQNVAIALAILTDENDGSVYPRWLAWANLWIALTFVPDILLGFFTSGPFAYQGVFAFWIPTVTYGLWLNLMAWTTILAIRGERQSGTDPQPAPAPA